MVIKTFCINILECMAKGTSDLNLRRKVKNEAVSDMTHGFIVHCGVFVTWSLVSSGKLIIQNCVIHICQKSELRRVSPHKTQEGERREIYSFREDVDDKDKDHHSVFYVMFYDA